MGMLVQLQSATAQAQLCSSGRHAALMPGLFSPKPCAALRQGHTWPGSVRRDGSCKHNRCQSLSESSLRSMTRHTWQQQQQQQATVAPVKRQWPAWSLACC